MSQQVEFYVLQGADETDRLKFACRIAAKAFHQGMQVYLQTENSVQEQNLDELLWTYSASSFLPHKVFRDGEKIDVPILIGDVDPPDSWNQFLISLTDQVPAQAYRFKRIADLIGDDEKQKQVGRDRFRTYRNNGIEPNTHKMNA